MKLGLHQYEAQAAVAQLCLASACACALCTFRAVTSRHPGGLQLKNLRLEEARRKVVHLFTQPHKK